MTDWKLQVLVLDDEPIVGRRIKPALEKFGVEVEVFEDPVAAVSRIGEKRFDVVVTDVRMRNVDGMKVMERVLRESDRTRVILITGFATMELARDAIAKGAFEFIAKPFKTGQLRAAIRRAAKSLGHPGFPEVGEA